MIARAIRSLCDFEGFRNLAFAYNFICDEGYSLLYLDILGPREEVIFLTSIISPTSGAVGSAKNWGLKLKVRNPNEWLWYKRMETKNPKTKTERDGKTALLLFRLLQNYLCQPYDHWQIALAWLLTDKGYRKMEFVVCCVDRIDDKV